VTAPVGTLVLYMLSADDAREVNRLHSPGYGGFGNDHSEGQQVPATVVRDNGGSANLVCFVDGNYLWWATSRLQADDTTTLGRWSVLQLTTSPPVSGA
jgi:hypothetical protein